MVEMWGDEHSMCARKPLSPHEFREGHSFGLEQHLHVPRRQPVPPCETGNVKLAIAEMLVDILLDRAQARRGHAAPFGDFRGVAYCAQGKSQQVVYMSDREALQFPGRRGRLETQNFKVTHQQ